MVLFVAVLIRLPLWTLPGLGRDEALYRYWALHPDLSYAPLLQGMIWLSEFLGMTSAFALRLPMAAMGLLVLYLVDLRMRQAEASGSGRLWVVLAVATTPWQAFAGSILHPDNLLVAALLAFVVSIWKEKIVLAGVFAWMMVLCKPTGILFLPIAWWVVGRLSGKKSHRTAGSGGKSSKRVWIARGLVVLSAAVFVSGLKLEMILGMANFGQLDESLSVAARFGTGGVALVFLGGPLLLVLATIGFLERWRLLFSGGDHEERLTREAETTLLCASVVILFFLSAAILRGQFKPNWLLPAALLLLPLRPPTLPRPVLFAGIFFSVLSSLGQSWAMKSPQVLDHPFFDRIATGVGRGLGAYAVYGGAEESSQLSTREWRDYLNQYADGSQFAESVKGKWLRALGTACPIWIVSDDYGLAAQLHWYLQNDKTRIVMVGDQTFYRTLEVLKQRKDPDPILLLPVDLGVDELLEGISVVETLLDVKHPATGKPVTPSIGNYYLPSNSEVKGGKK